MPGPQQMLRPNPFISINFPEKEDFLNFCRMYYKMAWQEKPQYYGYYMLFWQDKHSNVTIICNTPLVQYLKESYNERRRFKS